VAKPGSGAINLNYNTSVRAEGMGGAGVGMAWGTDTNNWANPALLSFRPGVHYTSFETQLAEGLADDIFLTNKEMTLGYFGVTFLFAKVFIPGNKLDLGEQQATDENGEAVGTFDSWMESKYYGLGLDAVQLLDKILGHDDGWLSPYFSVAVGFVNKEFTDNLSPDWAIQDPQGGGQGHGSASDYGYLLRATPINMTKEDGFLGNGIIGLRLGGAYGSSVLNETDEYIEHPGADQSDPFPRMFVEGWSLYGEITLAGDLKNDLNDSFLGILGDMINPWSHWASPSSGSNRGSFGTSMKRNMSTNATPPDDSMRKTRGGNWESETSIISGGGTAPRIFTEIRKLMGIPKVGASTFRLAVMEASVLTRPRFRGDSGFLMTNGKAGLCGWTLWPFFHRIIEAFIIVKSSCPALLAGLAGMIHQKDSLWIWAAFPIPAPRLKPRKPAGELSIPPHLPAV